VGVQVLHGRRRARIDNAVLHLAAGIWTTKDTKSREKTRNRPLLSRVSRGFVVFVIRICGILWMQIICIG